MALLVLSKKNWILWVLRIFSRYDHKNPYKYFKTSPEIIKLAVMHYVRFPLSLRQVEDILHELGIDIIICGKTKKFLYSRTGD